MAKKDLLDRIDRVSVPTSRKEEPSRTASTSQTETRVRPGVIRRRRKAPSRGKPGASLQGLPKAAEAAPPAVPESVPAVAEETPAVAAPEPTVEVAPTVEQPVAAAPVAEETPAPVEVKADPPAAVEVATAAAPVEAAPAPVAVKADSPVEAVAEPVAEVKAEAPVQEATPTPVAEAAPKAVSKTESKAGPKAGNKSGHKAVHKTEKPVAAKPAEQPRADIDKRRHAKSFPPMPRLPGLGPAVIRPPPGWDPDNPNAHRKKAAAPTPAPAKPDPKSGWTGAGPSESDRRRPGGDGRPDNRRGRRRPGRRQAQFVDNLRGPRRKRKSKRSGPKQEATRPKAEAKRRIQVDNTISVRQLAIDLGIKANQIIKTLMGLGSMGTTINDQLDIDTASLVAGEWDYEVVNVGFQEEAHFIQTEEEEDEGAVKRPPVVTIMGHVDHGKTTLLDSIRKANVADKEAGGITQHISAYQVERKGEVVTFIDTPGHQAFTEMRARGANATDIVILVVAADDGIMPQTIESINHARAADVPIVVAINKCDKPGVNPDNIRQRLLEHQLVSEEYGGETLMVNVSALKAQNLDELLDAVLLVAELQEYTSNPDRHAEGVVLEAQLDKGRGPSPRCWSRTVRLSRAITLCSAPSPVASAP